jgi:hypothetical protein
LKGKGYGDKELEKIEKAFNKEVNKRFEKAFDNKEPVDFSDLALKIAHKELGISAIGTTNVGVATSYHQSGVEVKD